MTISQQFATVFFGTMVFELPALTSAAAASQCGKASWYAGRFVGKPTANGEIYNPSSMTAAHRTLPFGSRVKVLDKGTGKSITVRINNRGPFISGRIIDLSEAAAKVLGMRSRGLASVCIRVVSR